MTSIEKNSLLEVSETIFTGLSLSGRSPAGKGSHAIRAINIKDITNGGVSTDGLAEVMVDDPKKVERYCIKKGDVLLSVRGTIVRSAIVETDCENCIITSNLAVIRLGKNSPLLPYVLHAFIESPVGKQEIMSRSRSATMQLSLSTKDVGEIMVPTPPQAEQKKMEKLIALSRRQYKTARVAAEARLVIANQIIYENFR